MAYHVQTALNNVYVKSHYSHVRMSAMGSEITGGLIVPFVQAQIKENIKAPRHWPLRGESTGVRWIPLTKRQ